MGRVLVSSSGGDQREKLLGEPDADQEEQASSGGGDGGGSSSGSRELRSYKAIRFVANGAQSILNTLLVTLLASLANLWNWLASRFNTRIESTFCATYSKTPDLSENSPVTIQKAQTTTSTQQSITKPINTNSNQVKMTIEVSSDTMAKVKPEMMEQEECDQGIGMKHLHCSLPVLRLNSESFEEMQTFSEEDESSSSDNNGRTTLHHRHSEDSCSDYCSGSGSPVPGSPTDLILQEDEGFSPIKGEDEEELLRNEESSTLVVSDIKDEDYEEEEETHSNSNANKVQSILVRRGSDTSDSSVNGDQEGEDVPVPPEVSSKILSQVEAMFSDDHLAKDGFLLKHVRRRSDGFVSLKLVAGLRKVKQISREFPVVLTSLKQSDVLEVNSEGTKIRRKEPLTSVLKSLPIKQAKKEKSQSEKENVGANNSSDEQQVIGSVNNKDTTIRSSQNQRNVTSSSNNANSRRNSSSQFNVNGKGSSSRKNSNVSTTSSTNSTNNSRNNSFSTASGARPHPADLFRNVMSAIGSGEESSQVRRRGGSLPISAIKSQHRGSIGGYLSPNSSPPGADSGFLRTKSNSYCEGTTGAASATSNGMSPWLLRRKASVASSRLSCGDVVISGVVRQPRGPDGTKGFQSGYRAMILEERLQASLTTSISSA